jgi:hypothetical protein
MAARTYFIFSMTSSSCSSHPGPILGLISLILVAGGIVLQFLTILSGAVSGRPENEVYFLQSSTNGIPNARNPTRWAFFALTGVDGNGHNTNYGSPVPALPFDPPRNFGTSTGVPRQFLKYVHALSGLRVKMMLITPAPTTTTICRDLCLPST